jgi:tRNA U34 2-thiouridine synthase MnmA/TrmU
VTWIAGRPPPALVAHRQSGATDAGIPLEVQVRHGPNSQPDARVRARDEACASVEVTLGREDSLAPGQYAAFYQGGVDCLGAGIISEDTFAVPQGPVRRQAGK